MEVLNNIEELDSEDISKYFSDDDIEIINDQTSDLNNFINLNEDDIKQLEIKEGM
jgi:hypothetical protein